MKSAFSSGLSARLGETATRQFAETHHIANWSLHADRIAIALK
jgi:hypothetical protein